MYEYRTHRCDEIYIEDVGKNGTKGYKLTLGKDGENQYSCINVC